MNDLFPGQSEIWQWVEGEARRIFSRYHYREIRTPLVEPLDLFTRTLGETTALVEKEMYTFEDRNGKKLALRPEATTSVVRAYIESHYDQQESLARFFYIGPMYRYERPQKGRYRQFHQIGAEVFGSDQPLIDAELIHLADSYFKALGLKDIVLEINSLGCPVCRPDYVTALNAYISEHMERLCEDCHRRMKRNPLRVLDCKQGNCRSVAASAPSIQENLCDNCESHFDSVLNGIGLFGSEYRINPNIVRGLDYYQRTAFEFTSERLGAQNAVAGGGRYDGLVRFLGGPHVPGIGFAIGIERVVELVAEGVAKSQTSFPLVYIAAMGESAVSHGVTLAETLRAQEIPVETNYEDKSLKALMRRADKLKARFTVIIGDEELAHKQWILRDMKTQVQKEMPIDKPECLVKEILS